MALPPHAYLSLAHEARFHVQVALSLDPLLTGYATLPCRGRVLRVFRGSDALSIGDEVRFSLRAYRSVEAMDSFDKMRFPLVPCDAGRSFEHERLRAARVAELFLRGNPPDLVVADQAHFASLLEEPTERPVTAWPTEEEVVEERAKFLRKTPAETKLIMQREIEEAAAEKRLEQVWARKQRNCPKCKMAFTSITNRGQCPSCGLIFYASHSTRPTEYPL